LFLNVFVSKWPALRCRTDVTELAASEPMSALGSTVPQPPLRMTCARMVSPLTVFAMAHLSVCGA
jgi:hypothetical protein